MSKIKWPGGAFYDIRQCKCFRFLVSMFIRFICNSFLGVIYDILFCRLRTILIIASIMVELRFNLIPACWYKFTNSTMLVLTCFIVITKINLSVLNQSFVEFHHSSC